MTETFSDDVVLKSNTGRMATATRARYNKPQPYRGVIARFPRAILEIAKVSRYGATKHEKPMGDTSYLDVPDAEVNYVEAEVRHLLHEAIHGPVNDDDDGLLHKAQKAWEALADLEVFLYEEERLTGRMEVEEALVVGGRRFVQPPWMPSAIHGHEEAIRDAHFRPDANPLDD